MYALKAGLWMLNVGLQRRNRLLGLLSLFSEGPGSPGRAVHCLSARTKQPREESEVQELAALGRAHVDGVTSLPLLFSAAEGHRSSWAVSCVTGPDGSMQMWEHHSSALGRYELSLLWRQKPGFFPGPRIGLSIKELSM